MRRGSLQAVSPAGLLVEAVTAEPDRLLIVARPSAADAACPECGQRSSRVHSRYDRRLTDLPSHGRAADRLVGRHWGRRGTAANGRHRRPWWLIGFGHGGGLQSRSVQGGGGAGGPELLGPGSDCQDPGCESAPKRDPLPKHMQVADRVQVKWCGVGSRSAPIGTPPRTNFSE